MACGRRSGSLANIRASRPSSQSGVPGVSAATEAGCLNLCEVKMSRTRLLVKGGAPTIISNNMQPNE